MQKKKKSIFIAILIIILNFLYKKLLKISASGTATLVAVWNKQLIDCSLEKRKV